MLAYLSLGWDYTRVIINKVQVHPLGIHVRVYIPRAWKGFNW